LGSIERENTQSEQPVTKQLFVEIAWAELAS